MRRLLVPFLALAASCSLYRPGPQGNEGVLPEPGASAPAGFRSLAEAALAALYAAHPDRATLDGVHDYDGSLGDWSRGAVEGRASCFRRHLARLGAIPREDLEDEAYVDALLLDARLRAELLELEELRAWERDPGHYRELISEGLYGLAALNFAPAATRRRLATSRLQDVPALLAAARANLAAPPRLFTEIALDEFAGLASFIKDELGPAFGGGKDKEFADAQKAALAAVDSFRDWLQKDLLPRSTGSYALGGALYAKKLLLEEMVDTPADVLLERGYALLRRTQEELKAVAGGQDPQALLREAGKDHPPAEKLLGETQAMLAGLRSWAASVVDLPAAEECKVQETPSFRRSTSFASMQLPGPFEATAKDAYYSITLPEAGWTEDRRAQHLSFFSRTSLALISVHEAYPGHYAQFLLARNAPTPIRKALGSNAFAEGWAHYTEQLYAESVPAARLLQLQMALLRICRYVVSLEMHTRGMSVEKAADLFVAEGFQTRAAAEREARRGAVDPLYLVYTLGKSEILALREEWRARTGGSAKDFHNALLRLGHPPLKIARLLLLEERPRD